MPIPSDIYDKVCNVICTKITARVYEPLNSSYHSRWFIIIKKDGFSLCLVHSLKPLNAVIIQHSGTPPYTDQIAEQFSGHACSSMLDLYVRYDEQTLAKSSCDYTTFQTPYGALHLITLPMGWTNSVPIFHDDVTFILQPEILDITIPYIDDVPVHGPLTHKEEPFHFRPDQIATQENLKAALLASPALCLIDYSSKAPVILAVDTSHIAVSFHLCQCTLHTPDGLSHQPPQPGDIAEPSDNFKDWINNVYGFLHLINSPSTSSPTTILSTYINNIMIDADTQNTPLMPTISYSDVHHSDNDHAADCHLEQVHDWHKSMECSSTLSDAEYTTFLHYCTEFFITSDKL
ncbi:hypothetical protein EW146_g901 [Bondarzewia mesenterica]|uniref:Reverse transcriptase/retrotransposon-derived protein RNase H-like domain-containing protein n=1 Tax=Bondarzewia mesenterica TaxID=1095465 RepID=A0A4V6S1K8_9AGAM|nr:hypothetical protein EW146_g901 [Bondarzewia mesenterica]